MKGPRQSAAFAWMRRAASASTPERLAQCDVFFWQSLQAAAILVAVPIAFVFNLLLERFITGFTMGAVKG